MRRLYPDLFAVRYAPHLPPRVSASAMSSTCFNTVSVAYGWRGRWRVTVPTHGMTNASNNGCLWLAGPVAGHGADPRHGQQIKQRLPMDGGAGGGSRCRPTAWPTNQTTVAYGWRGRWRVTVPIHGMANKSNNGCLWMVGPVAGHGADPRHGQQIKQRLPMDGGAGVKSGAIYPKRPKKTGLKGRPNKAQVGAQSVGTSHFATNGAQAWVGGGSYDATNPNPVAVPPWPLNNDPHNKKAEEKRGPVTLTLPNRTP